MLSNSQQSIKGNVVMVLVPFELNNKPREDSLGFFPGNPGFRQKSTAVEEVMRMVQEKRKLSFLSTTFGVVVAGQAPVASSPPRPGQENRIVEPALGNIEFPIHQSVSTGRHVGEKDADLTVFALSGRAAMLPLHAH
jgi:hypothetical protein